MIAVNKMFHLFLVFFVMAAPTAAQEIHEAAQQGDLLKVKMLLENNPFNVIFHSFNCINRYFGRDQKILSRIPRRSILRRVI